ncbi:CHAT domain-containing tetratricopeptide repeat protein, partial [Baaleninema sp.]|uniref:CHAT domain-containing tetratricopeptide repeat protein n=1 Tax=Baaleninema sp. TaxID=3101197 RepID=UPI003CFFD295
MAGKHRLVSLGLLWLGLMPTLALPASSREGVETPAAVMAQGANPRQLLQRGLTVYENDEFTEAIELWQEATRRFQDSNAIDDRLGEALAYNYMSLAYQHLRDWENAGQAIDRSLEILENWTDSQSSTYFEVYAKVLNTRGTLQHSRDRDVEAALQSWQEAARYYAEAGDDRGVVTSQLNQAQALQGLGLSLQANRLLGEIYRSLNAQVDSQIKATALRDFGKVLRQMGLLDETENELGSLEVLQESLQIQENLHIKNRAETWLELGNTQRALAERAIAFSKYDEDLEYARSTLESYQFAVRDARDAGELSLESKAWLNLLGWAAASGQELPGLASFQYGIEQQLDRLPLSRDRVYMRLNLAWNLTCFKQDMDTQIPSCMSVARRQYLLDPEKHSENAPILAKRQEIANQITWTEIAEILGEAVRESRELNDKVAEAYALSQLGGVYELTEDWENAKTVTQTALNQARSLDYFVPELEYRIEWQLGRLFGRENPELAISYYEEAANSLKSARSDLLALESDLQFSFRDNTEPLYRELLALLLPPEKDHIPGETLKKALFYAEEIQLSELASFLRCDLGSLRVDKIEDTGKPQEDLANQLNDLIERDAKADRSTAFVYTILFEDRVSIILKTPDSDAPLQYFEGKPRPGGKSLNEIISQTQNLLGQPAGSFVKPEVKESLQELYEILIEPMKEALDEDTLDTLVFVLDGNLRNIPISALYDGENYLVDRNYAVAVSPAIQLLKISRIDPDRIEVLIAASTQDRENEFENFSSIDREIVLQQINGIQIILDSKNYRSKILLDEHFTQENLGEEIAGHPYSIVHTIAHGQFDNDPNQTFIMTGNQPQSTNRADYTIGINEVGELLQGSVQRREQPIDLLVLSACQTASGNNRAVLGIAGISIKSGANGTLAPLWDVSQESTAELMVKFYEYL